MVIITIGRRRFYFRSLHIFIIGSCLTTKNLFLNQCLCPLHPTPFHINSMARICASACPCYIKEVHEGRESVSEYDSWSDLGNNWDVKRKKGQKYSTYRSRSNKNNSDNNNNKINSIGNNRQVVHFFFRGEFCTGL